MASRRRCRRGRSTAASTRTGEYLLTAYNIPSNITVHRLKPDGAIGELVAQPAKPDAGIFAHQILTTPGNQSVILVARGNNAEPKTPEDPGALKVYGFKNGVLTQPRVGRSPATASASGRATSISTRRSRGCSSRSSARASSMSTGCRPTTRSRASRCS